MQPVTVISGTSRGIGRHLAHHYAAVGHRVVGCSRVAPDWTMDNYDHFVLSVDDESSVKAMFSTVRKKYGRIDNLINNAGIASMNHMVLTPMDTVTRIFSTNAFGTFLFCREASKLMMKSRYGRIVNFTTVAVPLALEGETVYAASKAAIVSMTQTMARELGQYGITVNAIGPTPVQTDLIRSVPENKIQDLLNRQAIHRFGEHEDIANVVDFFLRRESGFVTGQTLYLGGV
ncbi:SDR family oxidoreductase [Paenibacillus thiaminolyticus]|uniref:SDR family NAD(P)-dependent oxidoreductase n=1 Tax=Paenibacillus thiaminolyticus TaxID=49283 RepID=UPI0011641339|nr:SDR family oxidoreductase [Paenibacillus thiaminolyticus]NGP60487.1 SDR family oxidoreductase [Paenibacillus thiaminolyticus]WCR25876.1 SDR family oxidoreductase [Paenibacillus thiaminolyticus]